MIDREYVAWVDIPVTARAVLAEIYDRAGVEIWWNSPNKLLVHYLPRNTFGSMIPREHPQAAEDLANGIADGVFF